MMHASSFVSFPFDGNQSSNFFYYAIIVYGRQSNLFALCPYREVYCIEFIALSSVLKMGESFKFPNRSINMMDE